MPANRAMATVMAAVCGSNEKLKGYFLLPAVDPDSHVVPSG